MRQLARISGDIISSGVYPDHDSQSAPLYTDAKNLFFGNKKVGPFAGGVPLFLSSLTDPILGVLAAKISNVPTVFFGTKSNLYSWDESAGQATEGSGYTGLVDQTATADVSLWRLVQWGNWVIATNGKDAPQIWKGTSFAGLGGLGTEFATAKEFVKWRQYLFAVNLDTGVNKVAWCDTNDPETWTPSATNSAGNLFIRDTENELRAARLLNDSVVLYSHNSMFALDFLNTNEVFGVRRLLTGIGAFSKFSVTSVKGRHYGFGPRGLWVTDGVTFEYIHWPAIRDSVLKNVNEDQASKIVAYHDSRAETVIFLYPEGSSLYNNAALAYNYRERSWSPLNLERTCVSDNGIFSTPIAGTRSGLISRQSVFGSAASPVQNSTMGLPATYDVTLGFGEGGFGEGGFGGVDSGTG